MNELLRLLRRGLRPFGYDVRRKNAYNLLPFKSVECLPELLAANRAFDREPPPGGWMEADDTTVLKIIVRTCIREDRNPRAQNRVTGASLVETVGRCLQSTVASVNDAMSRPGAPRISLLILDDHSDPQYQAVLRGIAAGVRCDWRLQVTAARGQGASLHEQFTLARNDSALYYFCEDDYLHVPCAIHALWTFYRHIHQATGQHLILHPQEHENLHGSTLYPAYVLLGADRHWRTMSHATHVLFTHSRVVQNYWDCFENTRFVGNRRKRRLGSEAQTTNRIFEHLPGFCPIPALAGHLQGKNTLPPFFDWETLWNENAVRQDGSQGVPD